MAKAAWASFEDCAWVECQVLEASKSQYTLKLNDGEQRSVDRSKVQVFYRNPPEVEAVDDLLSLPNLDEANILHSLRVRYWKGHVYSRAGQILLAVNPWRKVDIYGEQKLQGFVGGQACKTSEPHIFATAAEAYRTMLSSSKSQCVLISGESGAGKTESTKYVLQVLTRAGGNSKGKDGGQPPVAEQIMQSNPVLEAFGNAKTLRNDNSSRFGKWIEVSFAGSKIVGAGVRTYLLEKSRVVGQIDGERNFHIFYDLCAAATAGDKAVGDFGLGDAGRFANTRACTRAGVRDDAASFDQVRSAMDTMGLEKECQWSIFAGVSAILHLCSIEVGEENDFDGNSVATVDVKGSSIQQAAKLLKVSAAELKEGLCTRIITTGRESMRKPENRENALLCLQALCKQLYSKIFERVVDLVNKAMKVGGRQGTARGSSDDGCRQVAVLDIFGFESFAENRFEQLCINHANEKLQGHFNAFSFLQERALMEAEGVEVEISDSVDNGECIKLLEGPGGVQATLDDVCKMPKGDDGVLLQRLGDDKKMMASGFLAMPKKKDGTFIIRHYAGSVAYKAQGFCERNKDILPASAVALMRASKDSLLSTLFEEVAADTALTLGGGRGSSAGSKVKKSVSATFKADLNGLMDLINSSGPHFVRCINPNRRKQAQEFEDVKAVEQLRCGGVIEAMRMARASFPCRYAHEEFARTYTPFLCPDIAAALPARSKCLACFKELQAPQGHFAVGKTLVLMRREVLDEAERRRGAMLFKQALIIQSAARGLVARDCLSRRRKHRRSFHAAVCLEASVRQRMTRDKYIRMLSIARSVAAEEFPERQTRLASNKTPDSISQVQISSPSNGGQITGQGRVVLDAEGAALRDSSKNSRTVDMNTNNSKDRKKNATVKDSAVPTPSFRTGDIVYENSGRHDAAKSEKAAASSPEYEQPEMSTYTARRLAQGCDKNLFAGVGQGRQMSKHAWVSFEDAHWIECQVLEASKSQYTLKLNDGEQRSVDRSKVQVFYRNPPEVEAVDDLLSLPNLDEANILHSLRVRYWKGHVYSRAGQILLAVNPWRKVDIYGEQKLQGFVGGQARKTSEPHIFATAAEAYRTMLSSSKSQCVLISGESGAGKTESTKYVLQVLTRAGGNSKGKDGGQPPVAEQIMQSNPVLEAFGNAKTLRNDNSSRFGKWIEVSFDGSKIVGAGVRTYLLEKSRVVGQIDGERNFHIFYDLCAAATAGDKAVGDFGLGDAGRFANTRACTRAGVRDDAASFDQVRSAMDTMGLEKECQWSIFAGVSAILHLCSIEVGEENDFDGNSVATVDVKGSSIQQAAKLLKVSAAELKEGLCTRIITTGRESMRKPENRENALLCLQALCKQLYSKIFERVVDLVNKAMKVGGRQGTARGSSDDGCRQVAVLDIFGFESFAENRFEQLCINHANEKLQGHFNAFSFLQERALMEAEGVEVEISDSVDNGECIKLLEGPGGVQATLDDVCKMPKGDDGVLLQRLGDDKKMMASGFLAMPKKKDGTFIIRHYAGSVAYKAQGFCERNKDILPASAVALMRASKDSLLSTLFEEVAADTALTLGGGRGSSAGSKVKKSVSATFKADLNGLMDLINSSGPHFVRCINPNRRKQAQEFEDVKAVEQLRCGGVIEAMRMARASFPCRYAHEEFARTYTPFLCPDIAAALPARSKCLACFKELQAPQGHFAVGKTLVLMRREVLDEAERRRGAMLFKQALIIQSAARGLVARDCLSRRRKEHNAMVAIFRDRSKCHEKLQAVARRSKVRLQYIRMLSIARQNPDHDWGIKVAFAAHDSVLTMPNVAARRSAVLSGSGPKSTQANDIEDLFDGDTEEEIEGDTEGSLYDTERSLTGRTDRDSMSSDTEPPSVASEDEAGMLERLRALGIGDQAVGHVMWVGGGGNVVASDVDAADDGRIQGQSPAADPPLVDGLVPLRAGRVLWAGLPIPCDISVRREKVDPIAEILKCKAKEIRRVLLWSRRQLHKEALARQLRYSIYEAEWMELIWNPLSYRPSLAEKVEKGKKAVLDQDAQKYQLFFFAADARVLRTCWSKMSDRKKKELIHFDRDAGQRDLMDALVQSFGYAPRFLAACHAFLTARETYKLAANIQRYFIRWADGKQNPLDPKSPEGTVCISANVESIIAYIPEEHHRPGASQPFLERVCSPAIFTSRPFMGGHERVRSSTGARIINEDKAGPYQRRLFGTRFTQAALGFLVQRLQMAAKVPVTAGEPLCAVCQRKCEYFCGYCKVYPLCSASCGFKAHDHHKSYCQAQLSMYDKTADNLIEFSCSSQGMPIQVCHEYLPLKHLSRGGPKSGGKAKAAPLAPIRESGSHAGGMESISSVSATSKTGHSMSSVATSVMSSMRRSKRTPPREPAPAITDATSAFAAAAAERMTLGGQGAAAEGSGAGTRPPEGPGAAVSLLDVQGGSIFGGNQHNPARLLETAQVAVDGSMVFGSPIRGAAEPLPRMSAAASRSSIARPPSMQARNSAKLVDNSWGDEDEWM